LVQFLHLEILHHLCLLELLRGMLLLRCCLSSLSLHLLLELLHGGLPLGLVLFRLRSLLSLDGLLLCWVQVEQSRVITSDANQADEIETLTAAKQATSEAGHRAERPTVAGQPAGQPAESSEGSAIAGETAGKTSNSTQRASAAGKATDCAQRTSAAGETSSEASDSSKRSASASQTAGETTDGSERPVATSQTSSEATDSSKRSAAAAAAAEATQKTCHSVDLNVVLRRFWGMGQENRTRAT